MGEKFRAFAAHVLAHIFAKRGSVLLGNSL